VEKVSKIQSVKVESGQIWADCDKRSEGRKVRVVACTVGYAYVLPASVGHGTATRIQLDRMRPTPNGYRLVTNADGSPA
jgi:hypothetical protein